MFIFSTPHSGDEHEKEVANLIVSFLSSKETLEINKQFESNELPVTSDFYLPLGCDMLGLPKRTVIELKSVIRYPILNKYFRLYEPLLKNGSINKFILLSFERIENEGLYQYAEKLLGRTKFEILDSNTLFEKGHKLNQNETDADINEKVSKNIKDVGSSLLDKAKYDFAHNKYSLFLGAGLSMDAKLPSWSSLLEELLKQENDSPYKELNEQNADSISSEFSNSAIITGRYVFDGYRKSFYDKHKDKLNSSSRNDVDSFEDEMNKQIEDRIRKALYKQENYESSLINSVAAAIKLKDPMQVITYNYDDLLEEKLSNNVKYCSVFNNNIPRYECVPIFHVHGLISRNQIEQSFPVLSEKEYHRLYSNPENWANVVQLNALNTTTCFFIGLSMIDPNQRRLLENANSNFNFNTLGHNERHLAPHYVFLRKHPLKGEASSLVNQEHWHEVENMMSDFGLNVIWFKNFNELPLLINYISGMSNKKPKGYI